ncbi:hypothetical protein [Pseudomonas frederiksbergensis]|jgi:hypothetical protein|uniref:Uncharacterized protein n=1 Tax=Pseudomonas frederiksbergensis TaxID=104087 RepID=A0A423JDS2_9PSED|nr:hypothetical protein [Pseudomonas frederiksbergensis]RON35779.1 hypothetical protein BK661_05330 [Pseudomonas frederiksbergensis]
MPYPEYSLADDLERLHLNQLALEAALMELTSLVEKQGHAAAGDNVRSALQTIGENAGHIKQGLAKLRAQGPH